MAQLRPPSHPLCLCLSPQCPPKTPSHSQASKPEPDIPGGGFIRAPCSKAKVPLKACCIHLPQDVPSPLPSFFDLMPQLSANIAPTDAAAGLSSQEVPKLVTQKPDMAALFRQAAPPSDPESEDKDVQEKAGDVVHPPLPPGPPPLILPPPPMPARDNAMAVDVSDPQGPDINRPVPEFMRPTPSNVAQVPGSSSAVQGSSAITLNHLPSAIQKLPALMIESASPPSSSAAIRPSPTARPSAAVCPSPTAHLSDAGVRSSAAGLCSSTAGECSSTTGDSLFAEGVPDALGGHDDLDESEPSLDNLVEQAPAFCAHLVSMLNTLDLWNSLVEHYKASKKSKKD
ncbi:hypothetical protein V8E53_010964 [Lactarius tabidus]